MKDDMCSIDNFTFLIGAARSGTTLLGEQILSDHPGIFYLGEPDYIWQLALGYRSNDILCKKDASYSIKKKIKKRFVEASFGRNNSIILDKTPSNCFRIPFLNELFPKAKYIHLIRDGREVALSASKEWAAKKSQALDSKELRDSNLLSKIGKTVIEEGDFSKRFQSVTDFYYLPRYGIKFLNYLRRNVFGNDKIPWGPKFPGIKEIRNQFSLLETCAIQWERSVVAAESSLNNLIDDRVYRLRYEEFIENPFYHLTKICTFMGISSEEEQLKSLASKVIRRNTSKWKTAFSKEETEAVMNQISFTLKYLGYEED